MSIDHYCFKYIVENVNFGIAVIDREGRILFWNKKLESITNMPFTKVRGKMINDCIGEANYKDFFNEVIPFRRGLKEKQGNDGSFVSMVGNFIAENAGSGLFRSQQMDALSGNAHASDLKCLILSDPEKMGRAEQAVVEAHENFLREAANDVQEEIYPRNFWEKRLKEEFARCQRFKDDSEMTLLRVRIDDFDKIQADYTRLVLNDLIRSVSSAIVDLFRDIDIAGHYGGPDFACLFPNTDLSGAMIAAERLREKFEHAPLIVGEHSISITISIGIVSFSPEMKDQAELVALADAALNEAVNAGGNAIR